MTMSTVSELVAVKNTLGKVLTPEGKAGLEFVLIIPERGRSALLGYVSVSVLLRPSESDGLFRYSVRVDPSLPFGADPRVSQRYLAWLSKATNIALWAELLTNGYSWSQDQILGGRNA